MAKCEAKCHDDRRPVACKEVCCENCGVPNSEMHSCRQVFEHYRPEEAPDTPAATAA